MIKAVFLDIDDTLLSFSGFVRQCMSEGFRHFHLKPFEEEMLPVFERINSGLWQRLERGEITAEQLWEVRWSAIFRELGIDFSGPVFEEYFRAQLFESAIPEPGAMEILNYLKNRYILCAASNGPLLQQLNRLEKGGLTGCFHLIAVSSQIGAQKPDPAFFDYCFDRLRETALPTLAPDEAIMIGDSVTSDIAGGQRYGMKTCLYQKKPRTKPLAVRPDYTIEKLEDIARFL